MRWKSSLIEMGSLLWIQTILTLRAEPVGLRVPWLALILVYSQFRSATIDSAVIVCKNS